MRLRAVLVLQTYIAVVCGSIAGIVQQKRCCFSMGCLFELWMNGTDLNVCPLTDSPYLNIVACRLGACEPCLSQKYLTFDDWRLSDSLLLSSGFKIDRERRNYVREVRNAIFSAVDPTPLKTKLRLVAVAEDVLQNVLDLDAADCEKSRSFANFVSGNYILDGSMPLTHRYGGHQFGTWADQLGDGRAHLLGEYVNGEGERWELQLKGSGLTPYSRRGDGRAVLRSSIREFLCSEAMHNLGIPTSRAAAIVVSNDPVIRDQFYNGNIKKERAAVVLRVAESWFRIGSLEILAENGETNLLRHLVDFVIEHYFPEVGFDSDDKYVDFFEAVVNRTISTVAKWMSVGFAHGVCNTDNFSLLGVTIDYGPFGFVEAYDPNFVPNTSDDEGRYALERQPSVAMYNMNKLMLALLPLVGKHGHTEMDKILGKFNERYQALLMNLFRKKLGLFNEFENDALLVGALLYLMEETRADFTMTFRQLGEISRDQMIENSIPPRLWALADLKTHKMFPKWIESYQKRLKENPPGITDKKRMQRMNSVNPRYVLRNWMAEQAIKKAENNDFSEVRKLFRILCNPYTVQTEAEKAGFANKRPAWADRLKVSCSS